MRKELEGHFEKVLWSLLEYQKFFGVDEMSIYATEALKALHHIEWEFIKAGLVNKTMHETLSGRTNSNIVRLHGIKDNDDSNSIS